MSNKLDLAAYGVAELSEDQKNKVEGGIISLILLGGALYSLCTAKKVGSGLFYLGMFVLSAIAHDQ